MNCLQVKEIVSALLDEQNEKTKSQFERLTMKLETMETHVLEIKNAIIKV
jgi:hypothetical protein